MEPRPDRTRPWFQFHLSTALAVMLAASVLLGMNIVRRPWYATVTPESGGRYEIEFTVTGWPFAYESPGDSFERAVTKAERENFLDPSLTQPDASTREGMDGVGFCWIDPWPAVSERPWYNIVIALVILMYVATFAELLVRRVERRR
jgi:hypothetical protein